VKGRRSARNRRRRRNESSNRLQERPCPREGYGNRRKGLKAEGRRRGRPGRAADRAARAAMAGVRATVLVRAPVGIIRDVGVAVALSGVRRGAGDTMLSARLREQQHGDDKQGAHTSRRSPESGEDIHTWIFGSAGTPVKASAPSCHGRIHYLRSAWQLRLARAPLGGVCRWRVSPASLALTAADGQLRSRPAWVLRGPPSQLRS
jgi:hypothetical protein